MSRKQKILVVDDEPDHCALLRRVLEEAGYCVEVAYDGLECVQKVGAAPPDAIVLDIVMPEKDGCAVYRELKRHADYCRIPILVVTVQGLSITSTRYSRYHPFESPGDDYLAKPTSARELTSCLSQLLRQ
jgi:two-component system alkaline phosphatase synthesis response regulator PhoP